MAPPLAALGPRAGLLRTCLLWDQHPGPDKISGGLVGTFSHLFIDPLPEVYKPGWQGRGYVGSAGGLWLTLVGSPRFFLQGKDLSGQLTKHPSTGTPYLLRVTQKKAVGSEEPRWHV